MQTRILVVDDDPRVLQLAVHMLQPVADHVRTAGSVPDAIAVLEREAVSLVLTALQMGALGGEDLLAEVRRRWPRLPVVVITSHGSIERAVSLMQQGATDFICKPLQPEVLLPRIERALSRAALEDDVARLQARLGAIGEPRRALVGDAPAFRKVLDRLPFIARVDAAVLLTGETGTGKELVARALHDLSPRHGGPFVPVNCGALPEALMESELFGHRAGAFTGARGEKRGLIAEAEGGTLFLDEVGDIPLPLQVKLLRFLQESEIRPVGATQLVAVDARVIAATHHDLTEAIDAGTFREDLFYRLNVVPLHLPPLRERPGDIPALAAHALGRAKRATSRHGLRFSPEGLKKLAARRWAGNVRELENVVQRSIIYATGEVINADDIEFDAERTTATCGPDLSVSMGDAKEALIAQFERAYIESALRAAGGNVAQAARRAGRDRKSFHDLIHRYDIDVDRHRG